MLLEMGTMMTEMLEFAGLGVAMENATENCKAAADIVCDCCKMMEWRVSCTAFRT